MTIRVLLADDQEKVRAGLRLILAAEPDIEVMAEAGDGHDAVAVARRLRPDVTLMDIRMPQLDGIRPTRQLLAAAPPPTRVVVLTTFDIDSYVYEALRADASGFLLKNAPAEELVHAIRVVASGEGSSIRPSPGG
jgi:DNA-binding NarL/FixJ family response regulator